MSDPGTGVQTSVYGKDKADLEMHALDQAREFFGKEVQLQIVPGYRADADNSAEPEKRYRALIIVREVSP